MLIPPNPNYEALNLPLKRTKQLSARLQLAERRRTWTALNSVERWWAHFSLTTIERQWRNGRRRGRILWSRGHARWPTSDTNLWRFLFPSRSSPAAI